MSLPVGSAMLVGELYENAYGIGKEILVIQAAREEGSAVKMRLACDALNEMSQRATVLSALLGRKLSTHTKRNPLSGLRK